MLQGLTLVLAVFIATRASAAPPQLPTYVALGSANFHATDAGTEDANFTTNVSAGDLIYIGFIYQTTSTGMNSVIGSVTDSLGDIYSYAVAPTAADTGWAMAVMYTIAKASGNPVIHYNLAAHGAVEVHALAYSGISSDSPVDVTGTGQGTTHSVTEGTVTTTSGNDLLLVLVNDGTGGSVTATSGTGYTVRSGLPDGVAVDGIATSPGSYTPALSTSAPPWSVVTVAFRASNDAGQPGADAGTGTPPDAGPPDSGAPDAGVGSGADAGINLHSDAGNTGGPAPVDGGVNSVLDRKLPDGGRWDLEADLGCNSGGGVLPAAVLLTLALMGSTRRRSP